MSWQRLPNLNKSCSEATLQKIFELWGEGESGWKVVGSPLWLNELREVDNKVPHNKLKRHKKNNPITIGGYSFATENDILWEKGDKRVPIELKAEFGDKKPNTIKVLIQVLQHCWLLLSENKTLNINIIPVVVCAWNGMMRCALAYLRDCLFDINLKYLEATPLKSGRLKFLWLEEPLICYQKQRATSSPLIINNVTWFFSESSTTWIGLKNSDLKSFDSLTDNRKAQGEPIIHISKIENWKTNINEYLVWWKNKDTENKDGEYLLFIPDGENKDRPKFEKYF